MCLSNIYSEDKELLFKGAATIKTFDDHIIVVDIMGRSQEIKGKIESVDLLENIIYVKQ